MRSAQEIVDDAVRGRVLVFGSLPPDGRDLDLLAREEDTRLAADALEREGFVRRGRELARFEGCSVEPLELIDAANWSLPPEELDALFEDAIPLEGMRNLVRPSPHHNVLIFTRWLMGDGVIREKRRPRLERSLEEDPGAFQRAREHAAAWGLGDAVDDLERIYREGGSVPVKRARRRNKRGSVIALSGLDGAGKSSQAAALRETLERLGYDVEVAWTRIAWDDLIESIGVPLKRALSVPLRLLAKLRRRPPAPSPQAAGGEELRDDPVKRLRESSGLLTHAWLLLIAFANAWSQRSLTRDHVRRGGIVICDRYTLDSIVALRHSYGEGRRFRPQRALISLISPTPKRAYFLDVSPEVAFERKGEWDLEWLAGHRRLYLEEAGPLKVRVLAGEQEREQICAQIAADVWLAL